MRMMKSHATMTIEHADSQREYVFWKYKIFQNWIFTPPQKKSRIYYKDPSRKIISWRVQTLSHPILTRLYNLFYPNGRKIVPNNIADLLNPLTLSVWFMDDGSRKTYGRGAFLHTQNFSLKGQKRLIEALKERFGLEARISSHGYWKSRQLFRLYITAASFPRLKKIISPHILSQFVYKIA